MEKYTVINTVLAVGIGVISVLLVLLLQEYRNIYNLLKEEYKILKERIDKIEKECN